MARINMHKNVADEIRIFNEYCKIVSIQGVQTRSERN